jgi:UDP-glucose 4-epimerase
MRAWVIGSGGLLGHAITREAESRNKQSATKIELHSPPRIPWADEVAATHVLEEQVAEFARKLGGQTWAIIWAAGASIVASGVEQTQSELRVFTAIARAVRDHLPRNQGTFFVTSSAGGVYAGATKPPFSAASLPQPNSPYGQLKLDQEAVAAELCAPMCSVIIGRFSNLYGPARDKHKQQGLIQRLCAASMQRTAINLYVSMETVRDYLFIEDAARLVWESIEANDLNAQSGVKVLVLASGEGSSIAEIIATVQSVTHRRVPLALGSDPSSDRQVIDLRFTPSLTTEQMAGLTPLPIGVRRIFDSILGGVA